MYKLKYAWLLGLGGWLLILRIGWGNATPVWAQGDCGNNSCAYLPLVARDYDPTWVWGSVLTPTLTPSPASNVNPLLAIDRQGQVHVLWGTTSYGVPAFIYHTYLTAAGWTSPTAVAQSLGTSSVLFPPVVAPDGAMHLLWLNRETTGAPYRTLYAAFRNAQWGAEEEVYRSPYTGSTLQGMVHLDAAGQVHTTMVDGYIFSGHVSHAKRGTLGWSQPVTLTDPTYSNWIWPDQQGGVRFYGNDYETPPNLYYSYWSAGQFVTRDQKGPDRVSVSTSRRTQLDGQNNLHLFWSEDVAIPGGQVSGLYHQCINTALRVTTPELLSGSENAYASDTVKAAGFARWTALAWREASGARIRLAVWDGCNRTNLKTVPFPTDATWSLKAVAISDTPGKVCVLGYSSSYYPDRYRVICADILR